MDKKETKKLLYILPFIVALLIEVFIFNFRSFLTLFNREINYPVENIEVQGADSFGDGVYRIAEEGGNAVIYIKALESMLQDKNLNNVYIDIYLPEAEDVSWQESGCMYITPYIRDGGHDRYDILAEHVYRQDIEDSGFLWLTPAGKVKTVTLDVSLSEGSVFRIRRVIINAKKDIALSPVRLLILIIVAYTLFLLRGSSSLWKTEEKDNERVNALLAAALGMCLIMPALAVNISDHGIDRLNSFRPYQRLAEALAAGQLNLLEIPSEELARLDNPFDTTLRDAVGLEPDVDYLWDMAYYNGKYYCYFGVIPCLLFYLPVYLISGTHLSDGLLMMILAVFIYAGIYLAVREWLRRHAPSAPAAYLLLFTGMIFAGSGMMADISAPDAHDIPRAAGFAFLIWGLFLWQYSVRKDRRGLHNGFLAGGSLCMALAVGCRPNQFLYSFMAIPLFVSFLKPGDGFEKKDRNRSIAALMIPYIPVAAGLMAYNVLRFGSVFDFGYDYQLTVLDYSKKNILIDRIVIGLYEYLIRLPQMTYRFPFMVEGSFVQENAFGHGSFYYTFGYGGIFTCNLLSWFIPVIFSGKGKDKGGLWLTGLSAVNMIINICVAGVAYHYRVDFSPMILAAGAIGAVRLRNIAGRDAEGIIRTFLTAAFVLSILYHSSFYYMGGLSASDTALYYRLLYGWLG
ncbi:MAG: hypothetical protein J6X66_07445 [Lachnospiraceae bacterium]|nr:hypothetical protein [Lachnospiraceae bacterium]